MSDKIFSETFDDSTGLFVAEVEVTAPEGPWPAMVNLEVLADGTLLPEDARALAEVLRRAADLADKASDEDARV